MLSDVCSTFDNEILDWQALKISELTQMSDVQELKWVNALGKYPELN